MGVYFEPRYNINKDLQLYIGVAGESISFPNRAAAEIDFYGGIRPTFGMFAFDFGFGIISIRAGICFNAAVYKLAFATSRLLACRTATSSRPT